MMDVMCLELLPGKKMKLSRSEHNMSMMLTFEGLCDASSGPMQHLGASALHVWCREACDVFPRVRCFCSPRPA